MCSTLKKKWLFNEHWIEIILPLLFFCIPLLFPLPKILAKSIRQGLGISILFLFILFCWGFTTAKQRLWIPKTLLFLTFGIGLSALWANPLSEWQVAAGNLYFSDASQYYSDALRIINGFKYSAFSARHPFGTLFLSSILWLTSGNIKLTFVIVTALAASSTWLAAREVMNKWGYLPAVLFSLLLFLFYRRFIGIPDSENLGYILGCLSFALLINNVNHNNKWLFWIGIAILSAGLLARPGAFLVLPLIVGWWLHTYNPINGKIFLSTILGIFLITLIFAINILANRISATQSSSMFSNFSYTLYGIVNGGKGWEWFEAIHSTEGFSSPIEAENKAFSEAIRVFVENPKLTANGILKSYIEFFSLKPDSVFGILGFDLYDDPVFGSEQFKQVFGIIIRLVMMILASIGLCSVIKHRKTTAPGLILSISIGVFLSIPFLPPADAGMMRVYIATMPFTFLLPTIGLSRILQIKHEIKYPETRADNVAQLIEIYFIFIMIIFSVVINKNEGHLNLPSKITCPHSNQIGIITKFQQGSYINLIEGTSKTSFFNNKIKISDFQTSLLGIPRKELITPLTTFKPNALLFNSIDLLTENQIWFSIPSSYEKYKGSPVLICGNFSNDFSRIGIGFFVGDSVTFTNHINNEIQKK